ncbi:MAG: SDR family oxidoreductase [Planctomycetota bacterium]
MTMDDLFRLDGQTALVTGCSRGIGRAMAEGLAAAGADIIGLSASLPDDGGEAGTAVRACGRQFTAYRCDFADPDAAAACADHIREVHPRIDILVNNAGSIRRAPAAEHPDADWQAIIDINLTSQFRLTRAIGAGMLARGSGSIIFTASLLSFQGGITVPGYAASKGAIAQLTKALANEWAGRGVKVNAIAPGYIATDNTAALRADPDRSRQILERIPAGRWGQPEDFIGPTVFLASRASDYCHGSILLVDGGWMGR